ncbi:MAG: efflux RND transporter permease subunit, partial [bacterium]|nr:efflux RND transporter permease subunit [bacterium]
MVVERVGRHGALRRPRPRARGPLWRPAQPAGRGRLDQPAAVGLLLLIGVVVNNGIVMIEHINQYRRRGMERAAAMLCGGRERLRPILMTAITTLVGLVPIALQRPALA